MPSKSQNEVWAFSGEDTPVAVRKSSKKKTTSTFFKWRGIVQSVVLYRLFDYNKTETACVPLLQTRPCSPRLYSVPSNKNDDERDAVFLWWGSSEDLTQ